MSWKFPFFGISQPNQGIPLFCLSSWYCEESLSRWLLLENVTVLLSIFTNTKSEYAGLILHRCGTGFLKMFSLRARLLEKLNKRETVTVSPEPTQTTTSSGLDDEESESPSAPLVRSLSSVTEGKVVEDFSSEQLHFIVDYIGSAHISEAQSVPLLLETLKRIKKQQFETIRVDFTILDGVLKVSNVDSNALLLTAPLYAVSLCAKEQLRGYEHTFGMNITRKKIHMCHAFQAGSKLEVGCSIVYFYICRNSYWAIVFHGFKEFNQL